MLMYRRCWCCVGYSSFALYIVAFACADMMAFVFIFKQETAYEMRMSDWSSDVCSSDLLCRPARSERPDWRHDAVSRPGRNAHLRGRTIPPCPSAVQRRAAGRSRRVPVDFGQSVQIGRAHV